MYHSLHPHYYFQHVIPKPFLLSDLQTRREVLQGEIPFATLRRTKVQTQGCPSLLPLHLLGRVASGAEGREKCFWSPEKRAACSDEGVCVGFWGLSLGDLPSEVGIASLERQTWYLQRRCGSSGEVREGTLPRRPTWPGAALFCYSKGLRGHGFS